MSLVKTVSEYQGTTRKPPERKSYVFTAKVNLIAKFKPTSSEFTGFPENAS